MNIVLEKDLSKAKAVCTILNSSLFFAYFFLLKEESTGRYINIRFYDLHEMILYPRLEIVKPLNVVFDRYKSEEFPALRNQFDQNFDCRYNEFWEEKEQRPHQGRLWAALNKPIDPAPVRLRFDLDVCQAIGVDISDAELRDLYAVIVKEMIITRGLTKD